MIEDPLSGEPALGDVSTAKVRRNGLTSVPTEFCVEDGKKAAQPCRAHMARAFSPRFALVERKGRHVCTRASVAARLPAGAADAGLEIDGVKHRRLCRPWRDEAPVGSSMAEAPSRSASSWTQRIAPRSVGTGRPMASAPEARASCRPPYAARPAPRASLCRPSRSILNEWRWSSLSIRKLWYGTAAGRRRRRPAVQMRGRRARPGHGGMEQGQAHRGRCGLGQARCSSSRRRCVLQVTQPPTKLASLSGGLVLLAEGSGGSILLWHRDAVAGRRRASRPSFCRRSTAAPSSRRFRRSGVPARGAGGAEHREGVPGQSHKAGRSNFGRAAAYQDRPVERRRQESACAPPIRTSRASAR